jgi:hypothetical protein
MDATGWVVSMMAVFLDQSGDRFFDLDEHPGIITIPDSKTAPSAFS